MHQIHARHARFYSLMVTRNIPLEPAAICIQLADDPCWDCSNSGSICPARDKHIRNKQGHTSTTVLLEIHFNALTFFQPFLGTGPITDLGIFSSRRAKPDTLQCQKMPVLFTITPCCLTVTSPADIRNFTCQTNKFITVRTKTDSANEVERTHGNRGHV